MRSTLFEQQHRPDVAVARFTLPAPRTLRVVLGPDVILRRSAVLAHQGRLEFTTGSPGGLAPLVRRVVSREDRELVRVSGLGEIYAAHGTRRLALVILEGDALTVADDALLALDADLARESRRRGGAPAARTVGGHGTVVVGVVGDPLTLDCTQPTHVDVHAAVAWSASLAPQVVAGIRGPGGGEVPRYAFHGQGFVVVSAPTGAQAPARQA